MSVFYKLLALLALKATPQDFPHSQRLTVHFAIAYVFSGIVVLQTTMEPTDLLGGLVFGLFVQFAFTYLILRSLNRSARFLQTIFAIIGAGVLFNLISWPLLSVLADESSSESLRSSMSLLFLMLISWEVLIKAHIFKHALDLKMYSALALSFSLFFISVMLSQLLFSTAVS